MINVPSLRPKNKHINLYSSRWYMLILIRETFRWVSQKWNTKKTLFIYFVLLGDRQELRETDREFNYTIIINLSKHYNVRVQQHVFSWLCLNCTKYVYIDWPSVYLWNETKHSSCMCYLQCFTTHHHLPPLNSITTQ